MTWNLDGAEGRLLQRLILGALSRRGLLIEADPQSNWIATIGREALGVAIVSHHGPALKTVACELALVKLIDHSHLAWSDPDEGIWRTYCPLPETMPFQNHIDAVKAFIADYRATSHAREAELLDAIRASRAVLAKLLNPAPVNESQRPDKT
jgi:hypothetical protein